MKSNRLIRTGLSAILSLLLVLSLLAGAVPVSAIENSDGLSNEIETDSFVLVQDDEEDDIIFDEPGVDYMNDWDSVSITPFAVAGAFNITGDAGWTYASNVLTITEDGTYSIAMATPGATTTTDRISITPGVEAVVTLNGVKINLNSVNDACALAMSGATVNLIMAGSNELRSGQNRAGIEAPAGTKLTISAESSGSLISEGGQNGAGIGGRMESGIGDSIGGTITINNGEIEAYGNYQGAGIGGGYGGVLIQNSENGSGGTITVNGGSVIASGGYYGGAGIGAGFVTITNTNLNRIKTGIIIINNGEITASGGSSSAGIGGSRYGPESNITITGGKIIANGGIYAAGIGGGDEGSVGTVAINGGNVTATGGNYGAGIGGGRHGSLGTVAISGGNVTATGGSTGAGIGGGLLGDGGIISISGGIIKSTGNSGIGGGLGGASGNITITGDAEITANGKPGDNFTGGGAGIGSGGSLSLSDNAGAVNSIAIDTTGEIIATGGSSGSWRGASVGSGGTTKASGAGFFVAEQSANRTTAATGGTMFSVVTESTGGATLTYQWECMEEGSAEWVLVDGGTEEELYLLDLGSGDNGNQYRCRIASGNIVWISHPATLTISGSPTYTSALSPNGAYVFANANPQQFTITNTGTNAITGFAASFEGGSDSPFEFSSFLSGSVLLAGGKLTLSVRPKASLAARELPYTDTLTITGSNGNSFSVSLSFTKMSKAAGDFIVTPAFDWNYTGNVLTFTGDGSFIVEMATPGTVTTKDRIVVAPGIEADITLRGVQIDISTSSSTNADGCAFYAVGATVDLTLQEENFLRSSQRSSLYGGFYGSALRVTGGSLTAIGVMAGISAGEITITGGDIIATGTNGSGIICTQGDITISDSNILAEGKASSGSNTTYGAGIVSARGGISIIDSEVTAVGNYRAGVGTDNGDISISSSEVYAAGRGGITTTNGAITITEGKVMAFSNGNGAGIGGADGHTKLSNFTIYSINVTINITDSDITAIGNEGSAGIGAGEPYYLTSLSGGAITISGGSVYADGGYSKDSGYGGGAGIGGAGGQYQKSSGSSGNITIKDGAEITAIGGFSYSGGGGAGIGSGGMGSVDYSFHFISDIDSYMVGAINGITIEDSVIFSEMPDDLVADGWTNPMGGLGRWDGAAIGYGGGPVGDAGRSIVPDRAGDLTAKDVADAITSCPQPPIGDTKLTLPEVPEGFEIFIKTISNNLRIYKNGDFIPELSEKTGTISFTVKKLSSGGTADTVALPLTIPAQQVESLSVYPGHIIFTDAADKAGLGASITPNTSAGELVKWSAYPAGVVVFGSSPSFSDNAVGRNVQVSPTAEGLLEAQTVLITAEYEQSGERYTATATVEILPGGIKNDDTTDPTVKTTVKVLKNTVTINKASSDYAAVPLLITQQDPEKIGVMGFSSAVNIMPLAYLGSYFDRIALLDKNGNPLPDTQYRAEWGYSEDAGCFYVYAGGKANGTTKGVQVMVLPKGGVESDSGAWINAGTIDLTTVNKKPSVTIKMGEPLNNALPNKGVPLIITASDGSRCMAENIDSEFAFVNPISFTFGDQQYLYLLKPGKTHTAKITVEIEGYHEPVTKNVSIKVIKSSPKLKLSASSIIFPDKKTPVTIELLSSNNKVPFEADYKIATVFLSGVNASGKNIANSLPHVDVKYIPPKQGETSGKIEIRPLPWGNRFKGTVWIAAFTAQGSHNYDYYNIQPIFLKVNVDLAKAGNIKASTKIKSLHLHKGHGDGDIATIPIDISGANYTEHNWVIHSVDKGKDKNVPHLDDVIGLKTGGNQIMLTVRDPAAAGKLRDDSSISGAHVLNIGSPNIRDAKGNMITFPVTLNITDNDPTLSIKTAGKIDMANPKSSVTATVMIGNSSSPIKNVWLYEQEFESDNKTPLAGDRTEYSRDFRVAKKSEKTFTVMAKQGQGISSGKAKQSLSFVIELENGQTLKSWGTVTKNGKTTTIESPLTITPTQTMSKAWQGKKEADLYMQRPMLKDQVHFMLTTPEGVQLEAVRVDPGSVAVFRDESFELVQSGKTQWDIGFKGGMKPQLAAAGGTMKSSYTIKLQLWTEGSYRLEDDGTGKQVPVALGSGKTATKPTIISVKVNLN